MKKLTISSLVFIVFLINNIVLNAQENLQKKLESLKEKITEIQIDKTVIKQTLDVKDESKGKLLFTSTEVDEKGKSTSESYEFYLSDIDKNTVVRKVSGKKMLISLSTSDNQKFIKHLKEDKLDGYVSTFNMLASNADEGKELITLIVESIPLVKNTGMDWPTAKDALNWLKENIGQVTVGSDKYDQSFSFNNEKNYLVSLAVKKTEPKGATTEDIYDFNIIDFNKNEIKLNISGLNLTVTAKTKGGDRYIKHTRNGQVQGYESDVDFAASDIEQARNIINAIIASSTKSKAVFTQYNSTSQALDFLKSAIVDVSIDAKTFKQKFDYVISPSDVSASFLETETDSKGKDIENLYDFYPVDIDESTIAFKASVKKIILSFTVKNKQKFIKYSKDNEIQSFQNDLDFVFDNIENARCTVDALKYLLKNLKPAPVALNNVANSLDFLKKSITDLKVGTDSYKQTFSGEPAAPNACKYSVSKTDAKGVTTDESFEFYPYFLDANSVKIEPSGKYLSVSVTVKNKKSFIKNYKNNIQQSYDNTVEIMTNDVKMAKDIADAMKYLAANAKPEVKDWSNKSKTSMYLTETIGNLSGKGIELKQKLSVVSDDPCKYSLNVSTTDDKGKTTEEIYEFNLSDLNKLMVDMQISSKNVNIILVAKNKEKLIKYYKNGVQQSYVSEIKIMEDDVDTAQNLVDAFKGAIADCEK